MAYVRNEILEELRSNVLEVYCTTDPVGLKNFHLTLKSSFMPPKYNNGEFSLEHKFHEENPEELAAWDVKDNVWRRININTVSYVNIDGLYQ